MPLATGATALRTAFFSAFLAAFLTPFFLVVKFAYEASAAFGIMLCVATAVWPLILVLMARDARRRRASDIRFDEEGFTVIGGPHDHYRRRWTSIEPSNVHVRETTELFEGKSDGSVQNIFRFVVGGAILAESGDPTEIASLRALQRAIQVAVTPNAESAAGSEGLVPTVAVESCTQCGAPLVPSDVDEVLCVHCGAKNVVPASLRESIRLAAEADRARDDLGRTVSHALSRGNAVPVNYAVFAFSLLGSSALFLAWIAIWKGAPWLALTALGAPFALAGVARMLVARRYALSALTFGCAALTQSDPKRTPLCRSCRAPLPKSDDPARVIATCAYCRTANVLGLPPGLVAETKEVVASSAQIEDVLRQRRSSVRTWAFVAAFGVILTAVGSVLAHAAR